MTFKRPSSLWTLDQETEPGHESPGQRVRVGSRVKDSDPVPSLIGSTAKTEDVISRYQRAHSVPERKRVAVTRSPS